MKTATKITKKELKLNGKLQNELLKGAIIVKFFNGGFQNSCLVERSKEDRIKSGYRFAYFQDLPSINSDKMLLMKELNLTKRQAVIFCSDDHWSEEIHHERLSKCKAS
jgi:hypothetical protein